MSVTLSDYFGEFEPANIQPPTNNNTLLAQARPKRTDIPSWLWNNAPRNVEELKAVRYTLYHRCSRADFKVHKQLDDKFILAGRHSSVLIVSNKARRYLLWKLRILAREEGWVRFGKRMKLFVGTAARLL